MRRFASSLTAWGAGIAVAIPVLAGCGSGKTETVSVSSSSPVPSTQARTASGKTPVRTTGTAPAHEGKGQASHTAPAPAFTRTAAGSGELGAAVATVKAQGYSVGDTSTYQRDHTLAVLVGSREGGGGGHDQQAFFFVNGRYIGTDTSQPSASVKVVGQGDTEVTLAYSLYRHGDSSCCPSGGQARVRFQLNNGRLAALDPIPPASSPTGFSRQ